MRPLSATRETYGSACRANKYLRAGWFFAIAQAGLGSCVGIVTLAFFQSRKPDSPKKPAVNAGPPYSALLAAPVKFR